MLNDWVILMAYMILESPLATKKKKKIDLINQPFFPCYYASKVGLVIYEIQI